MTRRHVPGTLLVAALSLALAPLAADGPARTAQTSGQDSGTLRTAKEVVTKSGLRYADLAVGSGEEARPGRIVDVDYTGWLQDGTRFDSSKDRNKPLTFRIGIDEVIQGWHEGIAGMKEGGKRRLVIPPDLGYGKQGAGGVIPPNATLVFEVELVAVR